jgi:hypothetical protein
VRWMLIAAVALDGPCDVGQILTLTPRSDLFPRVGIGQIRIRDLLSLFKVVQ